jgi:hypothetical protein
MKRFLLSSAILLAVAGGGGFAYKAAADTTPPAPADAGPPPGPAWPGHPPGPRWGEGQGFPGRPGPWGHRRDDAFSLFAHMQDKNLSTADVKIIATAILLEHGNHSWAVSNVAAGAGKLVDFSYTTPHGDVIATFSVDPATGRIKRIS